MFLALISVSLGVLNLLPLPVLDGGHLMYYLWEGMTGKSVSDVWMDRLQRGGVAVLLVMMSVALFNDVTRLLGEPRALVNRPVRPADTIHEKANQTISPAYVSAWLRSPLRPTPGPLILSRCATSASRACSASSREPFCLAAFPCRRDLQRRQGIGRDPRPVRPGPVQGRAAGDQW